MHDVHVVQELIARLLEAEPEGIGDVRIQVGPLRSTENLELAYRMLAQDTPLEGSRLVVERPSEDASCPACGGTVTTEDLVGHVLLCPSCGAVSPADADPVEVIGVVPRAPLCVAGPSAPPR